MMKAPITSAQAMAHPTVVETINALGAIADEHREHQERLRSLLFEVSRNFTRDDDLPDGLVLRIDAALEYDGSRCLMEPNEAAAIVADAPGQYTTSTVMLTRDQFEKMPEHDGF